MKIHSAVVYSFSLHAAGADAMGHLRLGAPLRQAGIEIVYGVENGKILPERVSQGDVVIFQRELPGKFDQYQKIVENARREGKPIIFELDDLIFALPENHPDRLEGAYAPALLPMLQAVADADLVIVSTQGLKNALAEYNPSIEVLPNYFDDTVWHFKQPVQKKMDDETIVIGYMGTESHRPDLEYITPVILNLIKRYPQKIRFHIWGVEPSLEMLSLPQVKWVPSHSFSYPEFANFFQTQSADIFIAPLLDSYFNRCKSPLKFFEYSALGAPGVFSNIETYAGIVIHGQNGFLASSLVDWEACLAQLIENDDLRVQLALRAQETIKENWLLSKNTFRWQQIFENITPRKQSQTTLLVPIIRQQIEAAETWRMRVENQFRQIHQNEMTIQGFTAQVSDLTAQIAGIQNSYSWKLAQLLMKIRLNLFPLGSRREKWFMRLLRVVLHLKNYGLRSFARKFVDKINHRETVLTGRQSNGFLLTVQDGQKCPSPAISVVIEKNTEIGLPFVVEADVLSWIAAQTIQDTEVVIWDSVQGAAIAMGESGRVWDAPDIEGLCKGLAGRYLCMASPEMLRNNQTYLETNLVALESENLAFTVNVFGKPDWLFPALQNNSLPGNRKVPFLRQIVRTDCIRNGFLIDISHRLEDSLEKPQVVGKILVQTTASSDENALFPFQAVLAESAEYSLVDNYILARSNLQVSWEPLEHSIYPVDTVVSARAESSHLPTVMIFMPFLAVGGAERLALQLIRHLQDQIRFVVITTDEMDSALGTTADAFRQAIPFVYTAADYLASPLKFSFLAYLIERFQPDTFYIANGANFIYDVLGELRKRYPSLRIVNQVYDHQFGWINRYNPTVVASINAHISANPNISEAYISHGVPPQNISFVEHAISLDEINPQNYSAERCIEIKQKLGLPLEKKMVTFCARIHPQKRPLDFIELVRRFSNDESVHFLMVGDGPLSAAVDEQILRIGTKNSTRCKFYSPIADIYAITDVLVLPSEYEAMPLVVLETLAMGKPVVATDVGHIRDVVEMTHGGVIVPNIGDVTALRMGVLKALREPVDAVAMRQSIGERFGVSYIAQQYRKVWLGESHA